MSEESNHQPHPMVANRALGDTPREQRWKAWKETVRLSDRLPLGSPMNLADSENMWTAQIERDVCRTFPEMDSFDERQERRLYRILNAYASYNPDVGYCQGMNFVAGVLLQLSDEDEEVFGVFVCFMEHYGLAQFYRQSFPLLKQYVHACDVILGKAAPDLQKHFVEQDLDPAMYLHEWFLTLFINCLPLDEVLIIWDTFVHEGLPILIPITVSILKALEEPLMSMRLPDIVRTLKKLKKSGDEGGELHSLDLAKLMENAYYIEVPQQVLESLARICDEQPTSMVTEVDDISTTTSTTGTSATGTSTTTTSSGKVGWLRSISRALASISPKKRRDKEALLSGGSLSLSEGSERNGPSSAPGSPSKMCKHRARRHSLPEVPTGHHLRSQKKHLRAVVQRRENSVASEQNSSTSPTKCTSPHRCSSPQRRGCSTSPKRGGCSASPTKRPTYVQRTVTSL